MPTILLQTSLDPHEIAQLRKEFPQYRLLYYQFLNLPLTQGRSGWEGVEILYGNRLTPEQLESAKDLRWVHNPTSSFSRLCLEEMGERGSIIMTTGSDEQLAPITEFVMGGVLAFAKHLFHWHDLMASPSMIWDSKWRDSMWTLPGRVFLQVGLGKVGSEIAKQAQSLGFQVWGVQERRSFHRYCHQTRTFAELPSVLPDADVVSVALPRGDEREDLLGLAELELMKKDSILVVLGSHRVVNEAALVQVGKGGKFRGVILDALYRPSIPPNSPLWHVPHLLITPEIAVRPRSTSRLAFQTFHYNLRQYQIDNFASMRNRVELT